MLSAIAALVGVPIGLIALFIAARANRRADVANKSAKEALDFQKRVDARAAEFRHVEWEGSHHPHVTTTGQGTFTLENVGLTDAHNVTLVVYSPNRKVYRWPAKVIRPREPLRIETGPWDDGREFGEEDAWSVYWSSSLGHASVHEEPRRSLYKD